MPSFIGNDRFIILVLMMGIFYVFFKPSVSRLQKSYLTFIGVFFISMLLVVVSSTLSIGTTLSITSILLIVYASFKIDSKHYIQRLVKIIYYIALVSIIIFSITRTFGFGISFILYPFLYPSFPMVIFTVTEASFIVLYLCIVNEIVARLVNLGNINAYFL